MAEAPPIRETDGVLRVGKTTLETVVWTFQQGSTPEDMDIVDQFPTLSLADTYDVIAYYLRHRDEIDRYLAARDEQYRTTTSDLFLQSPKRSVQAKLRGRHLKR